MPIPLGIFATAGSGGAGGSAFELISTQVLASDTKTITFSAVPQTFKHLQIRGTMRSNHPFNNLLEVDFQANGVTSAVYSMHSLNGLGNAVGSTQANTQTQIRFAEMVPSAQNATGIFAGYVIDILDYSSTTKNKTLRCLRGAVGVDQRVNLTSGLYQQTTAISSFSMTSVSSSFLTGSRFSLYGIRG